MQTVRNMLALLLLCGWSTWLIAQQDEATFASVQQRLRANCYDCAGASEAALRSAIADLERLVADGLRQWRRRVCWPIRIGSSR